MPTPTRPISNDTILHADASSLIHESHNDSYARKRHYIGEKARDYDAARIGRFSTAIARHRWNEEIRAVESIAAALPPASIILDLPCGTGRFFPILAAHGHSVVGGDFSRDMLAAIPDDRRALAKIRRLQADAERIPLADSSVDSVLAMRFWSFLPDDARWRVLAEWRRVARNGVYVQVRIRSEPGDRACASSFQPEDDSNVDENVTPQQRANWPTAMEFARMTADAGFAIDATIALDWGPTNDPVIICQLRPAAQALSRVVTS